MGLLNDYFAQPLFARVVSGSKLGLAAAILWLTQSCPSFAQSYSRNTYYQNPDSVMPGVTTQPWALQPCRDPWINIAYAWALGVRPNGRLDQGECSPGQYAKGRWRDYNELVHAIYSYAQCMKGLQVAYGFDGSRWAIIDSRRGMLVGNDSASINPRLIAQGGGNLVGSNGASYALQGVGQISCAN